MFRFSTVGDMHYPVSHLPWLPSSWTISESNWQIPEDGPICAFAFPQALLGLAGQWEFCVFQGSPNESSMTPRAAPATRSWKSPLFLGLVALLCLLRVTAADPFLIPTENLALLAGLSGQLKRLIWEITKQKVNKQTSGWVIVLVRGQAAPAGIITLQPSQGTGFAAAIHVDLCPLLPWAALLFL